MYFPSAELRDWALLLSLLQSIFMFQAEVKLSIHLLCSILHCLPSLIALSRKLKCTSVLAFFLPLSSEMEAVIGPVLTTSIRNISKAYLKIGKTCRFLTFVIQVLT